MLIRECLHSNKPFHLSPPAISTACSTWTITLDSNPSILFSCNNSRVPSPEGNPARVLCACRTRHHGLLKSLSLPYPSKSKPSASTQANISRKFDAIEYLNHTRDKLFFRRKIPLKTAADTIVSAEAGKKNDRCVHRVTFSLDDRLRIASFLEQITTPSYTFTRWLPLYLTARRARSRGYRCFFVRVRLFLSVVGPRVSLALNLLVPAASGGRQRGDGKALDGRGLSKTRAGPASTLR